MQHYTQPLKLIQPPAVVSGDVIQSRKKSNMQNICILKFHRSMHIGMIERIAMSKLEKVLKDKNVTKERRHGLQSHMGARVGP